MAKILIAEDDEKIAQLEKDYLESNGYETEIINDGSRVIQELKSRTYDLVLLDIMLPGAAGMISAGRSGMRSTSPSLW